MTLPRAERPPPLHVVIEAARIAALQSYHVADETPEEPFNTLVRIAAHVACAPIALISVIGRDHQYVKAAFGCDLRQLPRAVALCNQAIAEPSALMMVPDLLADPRFHAHPMAVSPPYVRFYGGVCLIDGDGYALGTLCVMDTRPSSLNADMVAALRKLAFEAVNALALHRAEQECRRRGAALGWPTETPPDQVRLAPAAAPGWLGIRTEHTRMPGSNQEGRLIASIAPGSPAEHAKLRIGDIILTIDGQAVRRRTDITAAMAACLPGNALHLQLSRGGKPFDCALRIGPMPEAKPQRRRAW